MVGVPFRYIIHDCNETHPWGYIMGGNELTIIP